MFTKKALRVLGIAVPMILAFIAAAVEGEPNYIWAGVGVSAIIILVIA